MPDFVKPDNSLRPSATDSGALTAPLLQFITPRLPAEPSRSGAALTGSNLFDVDPPSPAMEPGTETIMKLFNKGVRPTFLALAGVCLSATVFANGSANAEPASRIDANVDAALEHFIDTHKGAEDLLDRAKGVLVFPTVYEAAFGLGGEYGEGALRVGGKTVDYYNQVAASVGAQLGGQTSTVIVFFFDDRQLTKFRKSRGWEVGIDGKIAVLTLGAAGELTTRNIRSPIAAVILNPRGLMAGVSLEGRKFSRIER